MQKQQWDQHDLQRQMKCTGDLAGDEGGLITFGLASMPEGGHSLFGTVDIDRAEHLAIHVDVAECNAKIRRLDSILDH